MAHLARITLRCALIVAACLPIPGEALSQQRPSVVIDAGHGGAHVGVDAEGWLEKALDLEIAFVVGAEFVRAGFDVVYTRTVCSSAPSLITNSDERWCRPRRDSSPVSDRLSSS